MENKSLCDMYEDVLKFHKKYGLPLQTKPGWASQEIMDFRIGFIKEEYQELMDAYEKRDLGKFFDALLDLTYVVIGCAIFMGLDWKEGWRRVQETNMKKVRVDDPNNTSRKSRFDVIKPPGWEPPKFDDLLSEEETLL